MKMTREELDIDKELAKEAKDYIKIAKVKLNMARDKFKYTGTRESYDKLVTAQQKFRESIGHYDALRVQYNEDRMAAATTNKPFFKKVFGK
jgi:hypothetical protein